MSDTITKTVKYLETHNGRDKLCRTLQYSSRFFTWYLAKHNEIDASKRFANLENGASMARKIFRLAKSISHFQNAFNTLNNETDTVVKSTMVVQQFSLGLWLLYDHVIWAGKLNLIKTDKMPIYTRRANIFWLIAMLMGIIKTLYALQRVKRGDNDKKRELSLELVRNIMDVPIPLTGLNQRVAAAIPTGIVGLFGTITSLIGIYQAWSKIK